MARLTRGERFKDARIVHNQHQKQTMDEVATATGVSKSLIQSLEDDNANRSVGYDKVAKLAAHYRVTTDFLLGLSDDPSPMPSAIDDLGLSIKAVDTIERLGIWDWGTPNYQITFRNACGRAVDVLNCLLESSDFDEVMGYLLLCLDSFMVNTQTRRLDGGDYEAEEEMRSAGQIVLQGADAGKFYATEAASTLKQLVCKEFPILANSFTKAK